MFFNIIQSISTYVIPKHSFRRRVLITSFSSININVIPSFGHIVNINEVDRNKVVPPYLCRSMKSINGENKEELSTACPETLTHPDMFLSALRKPLKNPLQVNISMITSRDQDLAEDWDSDRSSIIIFIP